MEKDTIQIDNKLYRVEINMNTVELWEKFSTKKILQSF